MVCSRGAGSNQIGGFISVRSREEGAMMGLGLIDTARSAGQSKTQVIGNRSLHAVGQVYPVRSSYALLSLLIDLPRGCRA